VPLDDAGVPLVPLVPDGGVPDALSGMPSSLTQPSIAPATQPQTTAPLPTTTTTTTTTPAPASEQPPPATTPAPPR
jgi:hypothetical protein